MLGLLADLIHVQKQGRPWEHTVFTLLEVCFKNLIQTASTLDNLAESPWKRLYFKTYQDTKMVHTIRLTIKC